MYEQKTVNNSEIKIFGIKIIERILETTDIFEREFLDDEEKQDVLGTKTVVTWKFLNIPILKLQGHTDYSNKSDNKENAEENKKINNLKKKIITSLVLVLGLSFSFLIGFYISKNIYSPKYNNLMGLEITSPKPNKADLFQEDMTQSDMDTVLDKEYKEYHKYFEKVVTRIKQYKFGEPEKDVIVNYIDGYEQRKNQIESVLFPRINSDTKENGYGTLLGSLYPMAMLGFDRLELATYKMILENMYFSLSDSDIQIIFRD